jgi:hypothetical protein
VPFGATEEEVAHHEERLGRRLPPSYREFVQVANGWGGIHFPLLHLCKLGWTRDVDPELGEIWAPEPDETLPTVSDKDYFVYGRGQDCVHLRREYMPDTLRIAKYVEGQTFMLNPHVVTPDGEWEAWDFATWYPGAVRYRSFWEFMNHEISKARP